MFNFLLLFNVVIILNVFLISAEIPDKRLCGNEDCTQLIGKGKTALPFPKTTEDPRMLSFKKNVDVNIYSKSLNTDRDLWGVEINGKRGYAYKQYILEQSSKMVPKFIVDTEKYVPSNIESGKETPQPTKTYVVDGTTLYDPMVSTESPTQEGVSNFVNSNTETQPLHSEVKHEKDTIAAPPTLTSNNENNLTGIIEQSVETLEDSKNLPELQLASSDITSEVIDTKSEVNSTDSMDDYNNEEIDDEEDGLIEDYDENEIIDKTEATNSEIPPVEEVSTQTPRHDKKPQNQGTQNSNLELQQNKDESNELKASDVIPIKEEVVDPNINPQNETGENSNMELQPVKEEPKEKVSREVIDTNAEINNVKSVTEESEENADLNINQIHELNLSDVKLIHESSDVKLETVAIEPFQDEMPNPTYVGSDVVTDNPILKESLHNETETQSLQDDSNKVEASKENSNLAETNENNKYLLNNENIEILPASQIDYGKLSIVEDVDQLVLPKEPQSHDYHHSFIKVNDPNELENQNLVNEVPGSNFGIYQNMLHNSKIDGDGPNENNEEIKEDKKQLNEVETQSVEKVESHKHDLNTLLSQHIDDETSCSADPLSDCKIHPQDIRAIYDSNNIFKLPNSAILTVLVIAAVTVVTFLWGYIYMEKRGRESNLVGKINDIQKDYLIVKKENEILKDKLDDAESDFNEKANTISNEMLSEVQEQLEAERNTCSVLELQIQNLEKELENSTEVGLELNRMLSEFLNSENGSETLVANIEQLQRQIIEQQGIINTYNENLSMKETENYELRLEVDINNTKVTELQSELNKMALHLLKLEEDKEQSQSIYESDLERIKEELESKKGTFTKEKSKLKEQLQDLTDKYEQLQKDLELKINEYLILKEGINQIKKLGNNGDAFKSLLDVSAIQAELLQFRKEKQLLMEQLQDERNKSSGLEIRCQSAVQDLQSFKVKYDEADREKVEATTKLQVLDKYFKEREAHLQKELSKQESMWVEKQGEATSTIERIKYMQEELQNYKIQNESLKQEILEQEVQMKSQISVLEKKAHENWVSARQAERKLEEAKQEASQLRNRLTLRERSFTEEKMHNRVQSPLEQNGELPISPAHISNDTVASPLLFGGRENLPISPPLPGLPFLPPPPGVPFMPPPLGGVPLPPPGFMPPPPSLMPGDHRPPPLGRISSPPLNSRYSPDRPYSPYSRNSPSPTSDDDYDRMLQPPMYRGYNSYNRDDRRELHRPPPVRVNTRNKGGSHSSGSANSNDSLDKINRHNSKV